MRRFFALVPLLLGFMPACVCGPTDDQAPDPRVTPRAKATGVITLNSVPPELNLPEDWESPKLGVEAGASR